MFGLSQKKKEGTPHAYIFIGRSGAGKGTQAALLKTYLEANGQDVLHIETGALLRKEVKEGTHVDGLIKASIESGGLIPDTFAISMWVGYVTKNFTGQEQLIFDGSPRKLSEAKMLDNTLGFIGIARYTVIYIDVSSNWSHEKLSARARNDDTKDGIAKRMRWFDEEVLPTLSFFRTKENVQIIDINGEQSIDAVHQEVLQSITRK